MLRLVWGMRRNSAEAECARLTGRSPCARAHGASLDHPVSAAMGMPGTGISNSRTGYAQCFVSSDCRYALTIDVPFQTRTGMVGCTEVLHGIPPTTMHHRDEPQLSETKS